MTPEIDIQRISEHRAAGMSYAQIARYTGYGAMEIESILNREEHQRAQKTHHMTLAVRGRTPLAQAIRTYRDRRRLSQRELAQELGYDHTSISLYEADKRRPTRDSLIDIAFALTLSPQETNSLLLLAEYLPLNEDPAVVSLRQLLVDPRLTHARRVALLAALNAVLVLAYEGIDA